MWTVINIVFSLYILSAVSFFTINFAEINEFLKNDAPVEISLFKKELNIHNKIFDYVVITLFIVSLPVNNFKLRREF